VAAALMLLMPLKRVEPYVVRVNDTSGVVDVVPAYDGRSTLPEAVTRYFLTHYITTCERFNYETAESDYEECGTFHTAQRNQVWFAQWTLSNPNSPFNLNKDGASVQVQVNAVSFFTRASGVADLAHVRYVKTRRMPGSADEKRSHWIATVQYGYAEPSGDPRTRGWNPLGFKILQFRAEPEVVVEERTVSAVVGAKEGAP
jgi:type IV secretion system protein VirB8